MRTGRFRPGRTDHDAHPPCRTKPYLRLGRFFPGTRPCHHRRRHPSPTSSGPHSYYRPSTAATLRYALEEYGTLDRTTILTPAIRLAEEGYQITPLQNQLTTRELKHLKAGPAGRFFLQADGTPYPAGSCFRQPVLAATLRRLADKGIRDFYSGRIAHLIHED